MSPLTYLLRSFGKLVTGKKGKHTPNANFFLLLCNPLFTTLFAASGLSLVAASTGYSPGAVSRLLTMVASPAVVLRL